MSKKKLISNNSILIALAVTVLLVMSGVTSFTIYGEEVYTPRFMSIKCDTQNRLGHLNLKTISTHTDEPTFYSCTSEGTKKYLPEGLSKGIVQCEYIVEKVNRDVYKCDNSATSIEDSSCERITNFLFQPLFNPFGADEVNYVISQGEKISINTNKVFGTAYLKVRYPSWGLDVISPDNYRWETSACTRASLDPRYDKGDYHPIKGSDAIPTHFSPIKTYNYVVGLQKVQSTQVVTINGINNGNPIYIVQPGYYYPIDTADDNFKYVDTSKDSTYDERIQCIPRSTGCSDDAETIQLEDQRCDVFGGAITSYSPVAGDSNKLCKYTCSGGTLSLTNDCIVTGTDEGCPSDKPLWNPITGNCASIVDPNTDEASCTANGGSWIPESTEKEASVLQDLIGFGGTETKVPAHCEQKSNLFTTTNLIIFGVIFLLVLTIVAVITKRGKKKSTTLF